MKPTIIFLSTFVLAILLGLLLLANSGVTSPAPTPVYIPISTPTPALIDCQRVFIDRGHNTLKCWPAYPAK